MDNPTIPNLKSQADELSAEKLAKAILLRNSLVVIGAFIAGYFAYRAAKGFWFILLMVIVGSIVGSAIASGLNSLRNYKIDG